MFVHLHKLPCTSHTNTSFIREIKNKPSIRSKLHTISQKLSKHKTLIISLTYHTVMITTV